MYHTNLIIDSFDRKGNAISMVSHRSAKTWTELENALYTAAKGFCKVVRPNTLVNVRWNGPDGKMRSETVPARAYK